MSKYIIQGETLTNIADAIREKTGSTEQLTPAEMADAVSNIAIENTGPIGLTEMIITSIELPEGVTSIGNLAFRDCTNLALTSLPDGVTSIGNSAFRGCTNLALTSLPDGVTSIGDLAFNQCAKLNIISLPRGVAHIGSYAFNMCSNLTTITFKDTPGFIAQSAFANCFNLTTINVPWAEGAVEGAPWGATNATINYNYTGE